MKRSALSLYPSPALLIRWKNRPTGNATEVAFQSGAVQVFNNITAN